MKYLFVHLLLSFFTMHFCNATNTNNSIKRSYIYLNTSILKDKRIAKNINLAYPNRIIFSYISKKINQIRTPAYTLNKYFTPYYSDDSSIYPYYNRLLYPTNKYSLDSVKNYISQNTNFDMAIMWSIYADTLKDSTTIFNVNNLLYKYTDTHSNVRGVAHAALVIKLVKDHDVISYIKEHLYLEKTYLDICARYLDKNKCYTDDGMEALLTFILLDRIDLIQQKWINEIISHQQADGGWKWDESRSETHQHPTLLAYWILSAWEKRNLNYNPNWYTDN